ncbi:MAG: SsrA-binding protein SmpB [Planctomycetota bacterium]
MAKPVKKPEPTDDRVVENRKARHQYTVTDTLECGIMLKGPEVKSVRSGLISISEGYVRADAGDTPGSPEPSLVVFGMDIQPYGPAGLRQSNPKRSRVLLAHKREIIKLARQTSDKGMTLVPLKLYFKNGFAKLLIGVAKGKQAHDKRRAIAERENKRDLARVMSKRANS